MTLDFQTTALILVDIQNDFLPGGTLSVPAADLILNPVNQLLKYPFRAVVATQDWHPSDHCSFKAKGGDWPAHCVAGTHGAALSDRLNADAITHIVRKGTRSGQDSYSGFLENDRSTPTGLDGLLKNLGVTQLVLCGVALDYCVRATAIDAVASGYTTYVVPEACRGISKDETVTLREFERHRVSLARLASFSWGI